MPPIVTRNQPSAWTHSLRTLGHVTITHVSDLDVPCRIDLGRNAVLVGDDLVGNEAEMFDYIHAALNVLAPVPARHLSVVKDSAAQLVAERPVAKQVSSAPAPAPKIERQTALRVVRPRSLPAACLPGCESSGDRQVDDLDGAHSCSITTGTVNMHGTTGKVAVSAQRYQDNEGTEPARVVINHIEERGTVDLGELTPAAARKLAASLLAAADTAEEINRKGKSGTRRMA